MVSSAREKASISGASTRSDRHTIGGKPNHSERETTRVRPARSGSTCDRTSQTYPSTLPERVRPFATARTTFRWPSVKIVRRKKEPGVWFMRARSDAVTSQPELLSGSENA